MELVQFPILNLNDIPAKLRQMADWVEDGTIDADAVVVVLSTEDGVKAHGFGVASTEIAYYLLGRAMRVLDMGAS